MTQITPVKSTSRDASGGARFDVRTNMATDLEEAILRDRQTQLSSSAKGKVEPLSAPALVPPVADKQNDETSGVRTGRRLLKTSVAAVLAIVVGWQPAMAILTPSSVEAFVNTSVVTLRSPVSGTVGFVTEKATVGEELARNDLFMRIFPDSTEATNLQTAGFRGSESGGRAGDAAGETAALRGELARLDRETAAFVAGRTRQLTSRVTGLEAQVQAASENLTFVTRQSRLAGATLEQGSVGSTKQRQAHLDLVESRSGLIQLQAELESAEVELEAIRSGSFVGDNYNNIPYSEQKASELRLRIEARDKLAAPAEEASILAPAAINVWEVLASQGEYVERGQPVARGLDCSKVIVTAAVEESVYANLRHGSEATFRFRGENIDRTGKVVRLSGLASAPSNLAISPSEMLRAPFRASVQIPNLTNAPNCDIGRTGRITFKNQSDARSFFRWGS
ncbi:HlyD family efflux transporter periplasmic adaptor subunit [Rhizobiaceae bacterium]|nr:HlyD family efflux transporter periplasmic adaptor subunit [Rhizobiaceae bacterium]